MIKEVSMIKGYIKKYPLGGLNHKSNPINKGGFDKNQLFDYYHTMKSWYKRAILFTMILSIVVQPIISRFYIDQIVDRRSIVYPINYVYAQTSLDTIKAKISTVVMAADGKITVSTKNKLIEIISNKVRASSNEITSDIYIYFLREVKKLRTSDEIIPIQGGGTFILSPTPTSSSTQTNQTIKPSLGFSDFIISFAATQGAIQIGDKFVNLSIKIKNNGGSYKTDGLGSLKFGCKGIDGKIYPYWSYKDNQIIESQNELVIDVPNVYIGNLTSSKGLKLLTCKIDSSDLINENNEDNNIASITISLF